MDSYDIIHSLIPPIQNRYNTVVSQSSRKLKIEAGYQQRQDLICKPADDISQVSQNLPAEVETSSSLILKKITNKLLLEQISSLSKQEPSHIATKDKNRKHSQPKNNTVIKIIIEPRATETQTSKSFLKRKHISKKIEKTVSDTDNCIHHNNLYLSRTTKQLYDIRETSSADLFKSDNYARKYSKHDFSLSRITYTKEILNSLCMDRKRRKDKSDRLNNKDLGSPRSPRNGKITEQRCTCVDTYNTNINKVFDDMNSPKNRVTIVGRLGMNENDQYILNYAATVDNKPIETQVTQQNPLSPASTARLENNTRNSKTTKATQASASICFARGIAKNTTISNKTIQCNCKNVADAATTISYCEFGKPTDLVTESKNPLIVISVYPTKEGMGDVKCLGDLIQVNQLQTGHQKEKTVFMPTRQSKILKANIGERKTVKSATNIHKSVSKTLRSRSPSPAVKQNIKEKLETSKMDQKSPKTLKLRTTNAERQIQRNKTTTNYNKSKNKSVIVNSARTAKLEPLRYRQEKLHDSKFVKSKIKKAIIDEYTQNLLKPITTSESRETIKRIKTNQNDASNVTINIEGENERYRVLFLQNKLNTDLSIRKTLKSQDKKPLAKKVPERKYKNTNYTENFLNLGREIRQGKEKKFQSPKQNKIINGSDSGDLNESISGLKIRDSLDISHWRESNSQYRPIVQLRDKKNILKPKKSDENENAKHYRGDKCCVPNPADRDQEIRELLGIKKQRAAKFNKTQDSLPEFTWQCQQYSLCPEERKENILSPSSQIINFFNKTNVKENVIEKAKLVTKSTEYDQNIVHSYQQMLLNRNIQVYLQVDQFTKRKPIVFSRQQYDKVKKNIQNKVSNRICKETKRCSVVSIGEIRKSRRKRTYDERINKTVQAKHNDGIQPDVSKGSEKECNNVANKPLLLLYSTQKDNKDEDNINASARQTMSSMEIRHASMTHMKHVTFSSSDLTPHANAPPGSLLSNFVKKSSPSIQTIFKGHKKSITPNLGTSAYSLCSDEEMAHYKNNNAVYSHSEKPKKPFLRRLMSCLVMRSAKVSETLMPPVPQREPPSAMNSFDSYHLSTSFGGIDMTSSLYDTSASFYSNHTILPIANMKRGFFSSVRGFLTNLKGR